MTFGVYKCDHCGMTFYGTATVYEMPLHARTTGHQAFSIIQRQQVTPGDITDFAQLSTAQHAQHLDPLTRVCIYYPTAGRIPTT